MRVRELIDALAECDPDFEVDVWVWPPADAGGLGLAKPVTASATAISESSITASVDIGGVGGEQRAYRQFMAANRSPRRRSQ